MRTIEQIVTDTKKPGEAILASLTPEKCDLWHAGTLLACELSEIGEAFNGNGDLTEEVGDALYAVEMLERHVGRSRSKHRIYALCSAVDLILDPIKAHCVYGKELDKQKISSALAQVKNVLRSGSKGKTALKALDAKLAKRYSTGYSDKNAIERKDKA